MAGSDTSAAQACWALAAGSLLAVSCMWGLVQFRSAEPISGRVLLQATAGGACWLLGMQLPQLLPSVGINSTSRAIALALCPTVIAVAESALGRTEAPDLPGRLWPGLAGIAGLLLLLPEPSFTGWKGMAVWVGMPLLTGTGAALIGSLPARGRRTGAAAFAGACVPACVGAILQAASSGEHPQIVAPAFLLQAGGEAAALCLAFWVLFRLGASHWAASLLIVPLLVALQGIVLLRPELGGRAYLGLGLLTLASVLLLVTARAARADVSAT